MKKLVSILLSIVFVISLCSCTNSTQKMYSKTFLDLFDTSCTISAFDTSQESFNAHFDDVYNELKRYSNLLDIYNEHDNNLYSLNKYKTIKSSSFLNGFFDYANKAYDITDGKVNVAFGSVLSQWHDAREIALAHPDKAYIPSMDDLKKSSFHTDIKSISIDDSTIKINDNNLTVDAGAIAKGYACERICDYITSNSIWSSCIINLGGNVKVLGDKQGASFNIAVENPNSNDYLCTVEASYGDSIVTSGDYERYFMLNGKRYCHIINVDTLMPSDYVQSVTVVSKDAALADVMSTYLFTMPVDDGLVIANANSNISVMWLDKAGNITTTSNWRSN